MKELSDSSRKEFEEFMAEKFEHCIDRRRCINGDGNDYMSWDMNVARVVWQHLSQRAEAAEAKLAELEKQEAPKAVVRHYTGCKYPIIKVNSLEVVIAGDREDAEELADFINSISPAPAVSLAPVSNCLSFFASVIKSGESWSATCQREMDAALESLRNIEEAK